MKKTMFSALLASLICLALVVAGCASKGGNAESQAPAQASGSESGGGQIHIGAALPDFSDKWLSYLQEGMEKYQKTQDGVNVTYVDAQNDASKQLAQIETFISQKVDAIVMVPVDTVSAVDIVDRANKANIPIVVVNRWFEGVDKAASYVGSESITAGVMQMEEVAKLLGGKGNIAIMTGQLGQEAQIKRTEGNKQVIGKYPDMSIVLEGTASWDRAKGMALMENWLNSGKKIDAVVSNNDEMAIGAIMAAEAANKADGMIFAGVDATPDALEYVKSGKLQVTVFQNADGQGKSGLETAIKAARGEQVEKNVYVPYELVTKDNVDEYVKKWE
ncbi:sugar ABC transporter substrate-binding protein [Cohnella laeviribosi]|uniref:sugar ABC transporter substrate-binding protein n=1 Tax=Cohnella laeviribosi TaxID=380174 RepID=UPI000364293E|nr:sugar ABC transporter substrate-binding protein [Cohnella laeviribosi]